MLIYTALRHQPHL